MKWTAQRFLGVALIVGCGGKGEPDSGREGGTEVTPRDAAPCLSRMEQGRLMVPGSAPSTTAPAIQELDTPYTIQLAPNQGGWVRLLLPDAGSYTIHTGFSGVLYGLWTDVGEYPMDAERVSEVCADMIPAVYAVEVSAPTALYLQLGPLSSLYYWIYVQQEA